MTWQVAKLIMWLILGAFIFTLFGGLVASIFHVPWWYPGLLAGVIISIKLYMRQRVFNRVRRTPMAYPSQSVIDEESAGWDAGKPSDPQGDVVDLDAPLPHRPSLSPRQQPEL